MTTPIIIDTDPGVDDAMAILYALSDPEIELVGLTSVFGNVPGATATRNALALAELAGSDVPVAAGAEVPLVQPPLPHPDFVHGTGGFGDARLPEPKRRPDPRDAADFLIQECAARPGEIALVPVGPLTNLALALDRDPAIAETAREVIVMGGAVRKPGNVNEHAEANIWQDPHAAARVFAAPWKVTLVGLDVTEQVTCLPEDLTPMTAASPKCGAFLNEAAAFYFEFHRTHDGFRGCYLHDPVAVIAAVETARFETVDAPVAVTLDGEAAGRTREDPAAGPPIRVCTGIDGDAVKARFLDRLLSGRLP